MALNLRTQTHVVTIADMDFWSESQSAHCPLLHCCKYSPRAQNKWRSFSYLPTISTWVKQKEPSNWLGTYSEVTKILS
jgi:hypothetical protein